MRNIARFCCREMGRYNCESILKGVKRRTRKLSPNRNKPVHLGFPRAVPSKGRMLTCKRLCCNDTLPAHERTTPSGKRQELPWSELEVASNQRRRLFKAVGPRQRAPSRLWVKATCRHADQYGERSPNRNNVVQPG